MNPRVLAAERDGQALAILRSCAAAGEICPTNGALCELLGMESVGATSGVLSRLERRGLIAVERGQQSRVVTIIETGRKTAGTVKTAHWRLSRDPKTRRPGARQSSPASADPADESRPRVDRDPCTFCGVRGDVGCKHRKDLGREQCE